jgi:hypothetical protein
MREVFFMAATTILAAWLVVTSLRRRQLNNASNKLS